MGLNIVEAYIKYNQGLVIYVSGISGCGKTALAKSISNKFNINLLEQFHYYKKGYDKKVTLPDGTVVTNNYTDDAVDWGRLVTDVNRLKKDGLVVAGFALVSDKLPGADYHIHLSLSKQVCMDRRKEFLESHKDRYQDEKLYNSTVEKLKMNMLIFPYYLDVKKRSHIDKVLNINDMNDKQVWDATFDIIIEFIQSNIQDVYKKWKKSSKEEQINKYTQPMIEPTEQFSETEDNQPLFGEEVEEYKEYVEETVEEPVEEYLEEPVEEYLEEPVDNRLTQ